MNREEFEEFPEIAELIDDGEVYFDNAQNEYVCIRQDDGGVEIALNLAWCIFKAKPKKSNDDCNNIGEILKSVLWHIEDCEIKLTSDRGDRWSGGQLEILEIIRKQLQELLK